jgi:hypothetical protein
MLDGKLVQMLSLAVMTMDNGDGRNEPTTVSRAMEGTSNIRNYLIRFDVDDSVLMTQSKTEDQMYRAKQMEKVTSLFN